MQVGPGLSTELPEASMPFLFSVTMAEQYTDGFDLADLNKH